MSKRQINYDNDKMLTAQRLKEAMDDMGMTMTELAEKSKVSKSSISQYTHAIQSPSNISANSMAKVLNVSPVWLMGLSEIKDREEYLNSKNHIYQYAHLTAASYFFAKLYTILPSEGKKEMMNYAEFLQHKYNIYVADKGKEV